MKIFISCVIRSEEVEDVFMYTIFLMLVCAVQVGDEAEMLLAKSVKESVLKETERKILESNAPGILNKFEQGLSPSIHDIKTLAKSGIPDEIILKHIKETRAVFRLSSEEIIDLKKSGVSQKVINFMIRTGQYTQGN